jgi:hypothetical protein
MKIIDKLFGTHYDREIKRLIGLVDQTEALETHLPGHE